MGIYSRKASNQQHPAPAAARVQQLAYSCNFIFSPNHVPGYRIADIWVNAGGESMLNFFSLTFALPASQHQERLGTRRLSRYLQLWRTTWTLHSEIGIMSLRPLVGFRKSPKQLRFRILIKPVPKIPPMILIYPRDNHQYARPWIVNQVYVTPGHVHHLRSQPTYSYIRLEQLYGFGDLHDLMT